MPAFAYVHLPAVTVRSPGRQANPTWRRRGASLVASLAPLASLLAAPAFATAAPGEVVQRTLTAAPADVREYWTPARMREARPVDRDARPARRSGGGATASRAAEEVTGSNSFPARTHGKVFFTIPGRGNFVCSGTVVRSPGRNVVVTAGHCVFDDAVDRFATNWLFVPGLRDGERPFGEWVAHRLATTSQFRAGGGGNERFDVGVGVVLRNGNGRGVQDRVGARRIAFNQPRDQLYRAFGYPAVSPFNGRRPYRCNSPYEGDDQSFPQPRPMRIDCDMTGGSSGGGWVTDGGFVASVVSYAYDCPPSLQLLGCENPEEGKLFGPYFGDVIRDLYRANRGRERRCGGRIVTQRGGGADNAFTGTAGPDVIHGGRGADFLRGRAGDDSICGGAGDDRIRAGRGANRIYAGPGSDRVIARARGANRIWALRGRNRIHCGPGRDRVVTNRASRVDRRCERVIRRR